MPPRVVRLPQNKDNETKNGTDPPPASAPTVANHKCVMCEKVMESKQELQDHFRLHANGTIDMKGKVVTKPKLTPVNIKTVPNNIKKVPGSNISSRISCDVCQEQFDTVTIAIQHKFRKHPNSNVKYFCGFCGKQFPLEICKVNHIKTEHLADKRTSKIYKCKDCTAVFYKEDAIKYHIRSSHQRVTALINPVATLGPSKKIKMNISGEPSSVYYCHLCGQEYMVKFNLQKHLEANHTPNVSKIRFPFHYIPYNFYIFRNEMLKLTN